MSDGIGKMYARQSIQPSKNGASVCHSAILSCDGGNKSCILNLQKSHGKYVGESAQIDAKDGKNTTFGYCSVINGPCKARLSDWYNTNSEDLMFDENTLSMEASVPQNEGFRICSTGAVSKADTDGQVITIKGAESDQGDVYITGDRKAIVVKGTHFTIYNPNEATGTEKWYTLMPYKMTEVEFSLSQALTGIHLDAKDYTRSEIVVYSNHIEQFRNGKIKQRTSKHVVVSEEPETGSYASDTIAMLNGMSLALNILQSFADAVQYTTLNFYFQKSDGGNHRVILMGGTKTDYWKYVNYGYYYSYLSFLDYIVPSNLKLITKKGMKKTVKEFIDFYLSMIKAGTSRAHLLVEESGLVLNKGEYYDMLLYLVPQRKFKKHQIYLYEEGGLLHQKYITWPKESLVIVKRGGIIPFEKVTKLMEFIDDTGTLEGDSKYWEIFQKVLVQNYSTNKGNLTDSIAKIPEEISNNSKPQSAYDLENMNG